MNKVTDIAGAPHCCWSVEKHSPVFLGTPVLRYADPWAEDVRRKVAPDSCWTRLSDNEWSHTDGIIEVTVCCTERPGDSFERQTILSVRATAVKKVRVSRCAIELFSPSSAKPHFVDRYLRWHQLQSHERLNDLASFCVRWGINGRNELRTMGEGIAVELAWKDAELRILLSLDAASLHPRWRFLPEGNISAAAPEWEVGASMEVELLLSADQALSESPAVVSRYPCGAEAGFVLTDHCDFDTMERLQVFLHGDKRADGWLGRGLKMTKGVFPLSSIPVNRPPAASLANPEYRALAQELLQEGSEIAPHALNESNNIPPLMFHKALEDFAREWNPATWIDHGCTLDYLYAMGGGENPEYNLLEKLRANDFVALWSYQDVPTNACRTLNLIAPAVSDFTAMVSLMVRHFLHGESLIGLHYLRSMVHRYLTHPRWRIVKVIMGTLRSIAMKWLKTRKIRWEEISAALRWVYGNLKRDMRKGETRFVEPYTQQELLNMAAVLYPERGVPLHQSTPNDLMLFMTNEVTHTSDAYTEDQLENLVEERGLHIGHTYILNQLPYIAGIFERGNSPPRLRSEWISFLDALTETVRSGRLWNPTAGELVHWVRSIQRVRCIPVGPHSMEIENALGQPISGFTLLLPRAVDPGLVKWSGGSPCGSRSWGDWQTVWGDLPPHSRTVVQWG